MTASAAAASRIPPSPPSASPSSSPSPTSSSDSPRSSQNGSESKSTTESSPASTPPTTTTALLKTKWRSIYFVALICILDSMRIGSIMVNSWPYLASIDPEVNEKFYGLSKSTFTIGCIVTSLLSGWLSNRISHTKPPIMFGQLLAMLNCLLYANLDLIRHNRRYGYLLCELLFGIATGATSTWRVHIAMSSTDADRSRATSLIGFANNLGFVLGPLLVLALRLLLSSGTSHQHQNSTIELPWSSQLSVYTAPAYLIALFSLFSSILLFFYFDGKMHVPAKRRTISREEDKKKPFLVFGHNANEKVPLNEEEEGVYQPVIIQEVTNNNKLLVSDQTLPIASTRPDCTAILACFVGRFCFTAFILYLMALAAPYSMSVFGWSGERMVFIQMVCHTTMGLMGLLVCLGYTFRLLSRFQERLCVLAALVMMLTFFLASFPWPFLSSRMPTPIYGNETFRNGTTIQMLQSHGCDANRYDWCEDTPAINVFVYHAALILCLGLAMPVGMLNLDVLYSRLLGQIKQGTMQGLFVAMGDAIVLCGPVLITIVYQSHGPRPIWTGEICMFTLGITFWAFCWRRLLPSGALDQQQLGSEGANNGKDNDDEKSRWNSSSSPIVKLTISTTDGADDLLLVDGNNDGK